MRTLPVDPTSMFPLVLALSSAAALLAAGCEGGGDGGADAGPGGMDARVGEVDAGPPPRDSGPPPAECMGLAPACPTLSVEACATVMGCAVSQCSGSAVACDRYTDAEQCNSTQGCRWGGGSCVGTATSCERLATETSCRAQMGCAWRDAPGCYGTARRCEYLSRAECEMQPGCREIPMDGGPPVPGDGGTAADTGVVERDSGAPVDSGPRPDSGDCHPPEGPPPFSGCHPTMGIECDGDWAGRCSPACSASECCSPQNNRFVCVPRRADGSCPAADLFVDATRLRPSIEYRNFAPDSCAIAEGCIGGPGRRRLLRFDTWTPNVGGADMFLGVPTMSSPYFEWSPCHRHYHFNTYAEYELLSADGMCVAAQGHKQAFCLLDFYEYPCGTAGAPDCRRIRDGYTCSNQGIRRAAQDVYDSSLDCQWIDITGVPPGDYIIRIRVNTEHILYEEDYGNNEIRVPFTIPPG